MSCATTPSFSDPLRTFKARDYVLSLGRKTLVMGIVNVTPDSFSDGGTSFTTESAVAKAQQLVEDGADILDIGGESTRPGSEPLPLVAELARVIPVIEQLASRVSIPISIDTYKSAVARRALEVGASIINDISAGTFDDEMPSVAAEFNAGVILMHIQGTPRNMQRDPHYEDVITEISTFLASARSSFNRAGLQDDHILVDPGIGFGKNLDHNLDVIRNLDRFQNIGAGVLYGPSRKSFIGLLTGRSVEERLSGTIGAVIAGAFFGADIVRVHNVREVVDALKVTDALRNIRTTNDVAG